MLAPSTRAADLLAGRRALHRGEPVGEMIAVGPAVPISRRSQMGVPVGVRANLALALAQGGYDVVHGFEPGLPSLSYLALRDTDALTVATFSRPTGSRTRPRARSARSCSAGSTRSLALSERTRDAAAERFPGDYRVLAARDRPDALRARAEAEADRRRAAPERARGRPQRPPRAARAAGLGGRAAAHEAARRRARRSRATWPARVHLRTARDGASRAALLNETAIFVPGHRRARARAARGAGGRLRDRGADAGSRTSPSSRAPPSRGSSRTTRCARPSSSAPAAAAEGSSFDDVAAELERALRVADDAPPRARAAPPTRSPTGRGSSPTSTCTPRGRSTAPSTRRAVDHAEAEGLGAIAITDHNVFGGALETVDLARDRELVVIPGEEVKTDEQGEVIGLFLEREIPRGMPFADTIAAIREQGGLVYVPHPFDRMHTVPDAATLHRHLADIDVFEVYNARLLFEAHNDEALRFARKYDLTMGAGSDAHVLQGVGTGALRMRAFSDPEEFLISLP